jgi:hypothetical protein
MAVVAKQLSPGTSVTVPGDLTPRWINLPGLAWLAVRHFAGRPATLRMIGLPPRIMAWMVTLVRLAVSHRYGRVAAIGRIAMVEVIQIEPPLRIQARKVRLLSAGGGAMLIVALLLLCWSLEILVGRSTAATCACLAAAAFAAGSWSLASGRIGRRDAPQGHRVGPQRRRVRRWAREQGMPLVEVASMVVAEDGRAAGIRLGQWLRDIGQRDGVAQLVIPATPELAEKYARLGCLPVRQGDWVLVRAPRRR